ncbi:hypothetical protein Tco_1051548, partial [Tanacetum coccineum]
GDSGDEANVQDDEDVQESDDEPQHTDGERTDSKNQETNDDEEETKDEFGAGNQVKDDAQATQKTDASIPTSSISSNYAAKFLNFDNIPPTDTEFISMIDINVQHEVPRTSSLLTIPVFVIPEQDVINQSETVTTTPTLTISLLFSSLYPTHQQIAPIPTPTTTEATTSTTVVPDSETLAALQLRVTDLEKDVKELNDVDNSIKVISTIQSEVPKVVKEYLGSKPGTMIVLSDLAKAEKPSRTFNDLMSTPIDFSAFVMNRLQIIELTQDIMVGPYYNILKGTCRSYVELNYNMEECYKVLTDQLDWNNPEGDRYPFDLSKPLPLVMSGNRQIVPVDYFFNNNLAYLQVGSTGRTYTTSLTKTKAAKYDLPRMEDMVSNLWGPIKVAYDKHALLGTSH